MKKLFALMIAILMMAMPMSAMAYETDNDNIITLADLQLITSEFVITNIYNTEDCTWNTAMMARETPLYGMDEEIVAFYVAFDNADGSPNGYLVVNASPQNPSVMEYAFATAHDEISVNQTNYYATMGIYLTKDMNARSSDAMLIMNGESFALMSEARDKIDQIWAGLNTENTAAKAVLEQSKALASATDFYLANSNTISATDAWGISDTLPSGWTKYDVLSYGGNGVPYYTMGEFPSANNHCGPTAAMNVLRYYSGRIYGAGTSAERLIKPDKTSAFNYLYNQMGGSTPTTPYGLLNGLINYINNRKGSGEIPSGISISYEIYTGRDLYYNYMKTDIHSGRMPLTNIWNGLQSHWINILGYYDYSNGNCYVRILDNWHSDVNRFYLFKSGSTLNSLIGTLIRARITN